MKKEELEDNVHDAIWDSIYAEGGEVAGGNQAVNKCVDIAVEYAKQEAIGFFNWKQSLELIEEKGSRRWLINYSMNEWSLFAENTEQLYQKYLESKNKTQ